MPMSVGLILMGVHVLPLRGGGAGSGSAIAGWETLSFGSTLKIFVTVVALPAASLTTTSIFHVPVVVKVDVHAGPTPSRRFARVVCTRDHTAAPGSAPEPVGPSSALNVKVAVSPTRIVARLAASDALGFVESLEMLTAFVAVPALPALSANENVTVRVPSTVK